MSSNCLQDNSANKEEIEEVKEESYSIDSSSRGTSERNYLKNSSGEVTRITPFVDYTEDL